MDFLGNEDVSDVSAKGEEEFNFRRIELPNALKNRKTRSFKEFVEVLLQNNEENVTKWLNDVANGTPTFFVEADPENGVRKGFIPGIDPNPGKALFLLIKLAEFAVPKQSNTVISGDPDNPVAPPVLNISIGGKNVDLLREDD